MFGEGILIDSQTKWWKRVKPDLATRTYAPNVHTTCSTGGLIDYFVSHANEHHIVSDVTVLKIR